MRLVLQSDSNGQGNANRDDGTVQETSASLRSFNQKRALYSLG
jgi:hypothetical protein